MGISLSLDRRQPYAARHRRPPRFRVPGVALLVAALVTAWPASLLLSVAALRAGGSLG